MALDDFFRDSPNYVNPDYVTDAQRKQQRAYSEMLMKRSAEKVNRPTGAIANMIDALTGRLEMNRAGNLEQQAASNQNARDIETQRQLMGQQPQQASLTAPAAGPSVGFTPPMGSSGDAILPPATAPATAQRAEVQSSPKVWGDKEATAAGLYEPTTQVASLSPAGGSAPSGGAQAQPPVLPTGAAPAASFNQRFSQIDPRLISGTMNNQMASPEAKALIGQLIGQRQGTDAYGAPTRESLQNGVQGLPVGRGIMPGIRAPVSVGGDGSVTGTQIITPQGSSVPGIGNNANGIGGLAATGRELGAEAKRVQGGATGESENIKNTVTQAPAARQFQQDASVMEDLIRNNPNIQTGPWAKVTNEGLRAIQNLTGDKLINEKTLAASDGIEKLNTSLAASMQSKWGLNPSAINLAAGSVPGNEKSRQGTLELLNVMKQGAKRDEYIATTLYPQYAAQGKLGEFQAGVSKFYKENPLVEPNTGHLIMDPVKVTSPVHVKELRLKKGTPIELPDGRIGWVP